MRQSANFGRYEIKSEIGRGGMATVYLAYDPRFKRDVALKVLPRQFTHDPKFRARFEREAQTIAALEHHAIVPVYDFGEEDEQPYLVMRYMPGGSLVERIAAGPLAIEEIKTIVSRIGDALDEAHQKGIVHRDLKPGNILLDQHQNAFLSDFGIVKLAEATATFTGAAIIGTPAFMSPEQAKGASDLDGRSDIYSLGVILFEMLTGQQPYQADTPMGVAVMHITEPVPSVQRVKADLPIEWEMVVSRALAKEREERFATAGELATAVQTVVEGKPLPYNMFAPAAKTEIWSGDQKDSATKSTGLPKEWLGKYARWFWIGGPVFILIAVFLLGNGRFSFFASGIETPTSDPALIKTPTPTAAQTATPPPTSTRSPSRTPTVTATATELAETRETPVPTISPTASETPTLTATATTMAVPAPVLISPPFGEYQSPITFEWRSVAGASYRVTLRHKSEGYVHTSDWIRGSEWTFDIPGEQFGEWEWFVTASSGAVSQTRNFVFNPFPGAGEGSKSTSTPDPYPGPPTTEPGPTAYP